MVVSCYCIWIYNWHLDKILLDWLGTTMTKNPSPMSSKNPVAPAKRFDVDLLVFKAGLQAPAVPKLFPSVQSWEITADNTVIIKSEGFVYICPSGMWQALKVIELD